MTNRDAGQTAMHRVLFVAFICLFMSMPSARVSGDDLPQTRSFYMGFTPWPYDQDAVVETYDRIQTHGDIVAHHLDTGVPWPEAFAQTPYHEDVEDEIRRRLSLTKPGKKIYLAITSLSGARNGLAGYWAEETHMERPGEWKNRGFDHPDVVTAFTNFALDMIRRFDPSYFNYGIEVSQLIQNNPSEWNDYVGFAHQVYSRIKNVHPSLPVFVSAYLENPNSTGMANVRRRFGAILDYTDLIGVSTYPYFYVSGGNPSNLPANWLSQIQSIAPNKRILIAETADIAENLQVPEFGMNVPGSPAWQNAYLERLLSESNELNALVVIWWCIADFDAFWEGPLGRSPIAALWRDTGLYDEALVGRPGLVTWDAWLALPRSESGSNGTNNGGGGGGGCFADSLTVDLWDQDE